MLWYRPGTMSRPSSSSSRRISLSRSRLSAGVRSCGVPSSSAFLIRSASNLARAGLPRGVIGTRMSCPPGPTIMSGWVSWVIMSACRCCKDDLSDVDRIRLTGLFMGSASALADVLAVHVFPPSRAEAVVAVRAPPGDLRGKVHVLLQFQLLHVVPHVVLLHFLAVGHEPVVAVHQEPGRDHLVLAVVDVDVVVEGVHFPLGLHDFLGVALQLQGHDE